MRTHTDVPTRIRGIQSLTWEPCCGLVLTCSHSYKGVFLLCERASWDSVPSIPPVGKSYSLLLQFISFLYEEHTRIPFVFYGPKAFLENGMNSVWDWILHHNTFLILSVSLFSSTLLDKVPFWSCGWPSMCSLTISCDPLSSEEARSWICQRELPLETKGEEG